jgi:phosphoribosylglycinamide formyltransferase-1
MENLIRQQDGYSVIGVISNNTQAPGLKIAEDLGIPTFAFEKSNTLKDQKAEIYRKVRALAPDLIALAGFMQIINPEFVEEYSEKILNIHPSLLPKYPGLYPHKRALESDDKYHGCSVHLVDAGVDTGLVLAQAQVIISPEETEQSLTDKVLKREHQLYPWILKRIASQDIKILKTVSKKTQAEFSDLAYKEAGDLNFILPNARTK